MSNPQLFRVMVKFSVPLMISIVKELQVNNFISSFFVLI